MNERTCCLGVLQKCPTVGGGSGVDETRWPWVDNCCRWETDGPELITVADERQTHEWGCHIVLLSFNRLDIFYNNQKKKKAFSKSRWVPLPAERRTWLKWRRWMAAHYRQGAPHSSLSWGQEGVWSEMRLGARKSDTYRTMTCWLVNEHKSSGNGETLGYAEHCKKRSDLCFSQTGWIWGDQKWEWKLLSHIRFFVTPWTV